MSVQRAFKATLILCALLLATPASAQSTVTASDIQRLQDDVYQAGTDVSRLRNSDGTAAARMQDELDDLRDEVTYLKVKMRKEGNVSRSEYAEVRDRVQNLRSRARGEASGYDSSRNRIGTAGGSPTYGGTAGSEPVRSRRSDSAIPSGQMIDVRLERELSSATAQVEDRFETTTVADLYEGNRLLIPAGSVMRGIVSSVDRATRTDRRGSLTVSFDQITVNGRDYRMRGTVTEALESEGIRGEAAKIGAGSAVGGIIGGIIGGVKGAVLGVLIGGGGTIAATEGKDVTLTPGKILRVQLDEPPPIR
jgi:hypothetical protein